MPYTETLLASSDYIDVKPSHKETVLVQVSNRIYYAGLEFNGNVFSLRLHAKFLKYRFPKESESDDLNDGSVEVVSNSVKVQKKFQIEPLPYHLIRVVNLLLGCNTISIDDEYWKSTEEIEQKELNEQFALEPLTTWLTLRDAGYEFNVYGEAINI